MYWEVLNIFNIQYVCKEVKEFLDKNKYLKQNVVEKVLTVY